MSNFIQLYFLKPINTVAKRKQKVTSLSKNRKKVGGGEWRKKISKGERFWHPNRRAIHAPSHVSAILIYPITKTPA